MPTIAARTLPFAFAAVMSGCAIAPTQKVTLSALWETRCATTRGWQVCVDVPSPQPGDRPGQAFAGGAGDRDLFAPWQAWNGRADWDALVVIVTAAPVLPSDADAQARRRWAGVWDAQARRAAVAAGESRRSVAPAYDVDEHVDAQGRRWVRAQRESIEMGLTTRDREIEYTTPVDGGRVRLTLRFRCSPPHPHCALPARMVDSTRWAPAS